MATRSRTSFQKRQKEIARMEKQRDKAARRAMRKLGGGESTEHDPDNPEGTIDPEAAGDGPNAGDENAAAAAGEHAGTGEHNDSGSRVN